MNYRERVAPSVWMYAIGALIIPGVIAVFVPIHLLTGVILGIALYAGYLVLLFSSTPVIEVTDTTLRVGTARVPLRFVGTATALTTKETSREAAGPGLDARAWTVLRGWVPTSAKVEIIDERDPIPYWLFSTRHPDELVRALTSAVSQLPKRG